MRVLLGSGGFRTAERIAFLREQMRAFFGSIRRLLFVPYALRDHSAYLEAMRQRGLDAGYELVGLHTFADPVAAVRSAEGLFVGGGNTFRLLATLSGQELLEPIRERVRQGMPYLGVSAGCNVATPSIRTTNDMPIVQPPSFAALKLVPFQVNPHYFSGRSYVKHGEEWIEHFGETRDERLAEFHEENDTPVVGLSEGATLWCENAAVMLAGGSARVFRVGHDPVDVPSDSDLSALLQPEPAIAYTVRVWHADAATAERWLAWMHSKHLAEVIMAGARSAELVELDSSEGRLFEARYRFANRAAFGRYEQQQAVRLRAEGQSLFPAGETIRYERNVGERRLLVGE
ncbi:MAG: dipeptidase PepE [Gemmataceae bacterium]